MSRTASSCAAAAGRLGCRAVLLLCMVVVAAAPALDAQERELPRVAILTLGGTIAGGPTGEQLSGEDFLAAVPELGEVARIEVEEIAQRGSSKLTPAHWLELSRRINERFAADPDLAGIVVTHGTDSLDETAFFLHLTVRDPRPVVVVGAMRNWRRLSPDGPANLHGAVRVAVTEEAEGKGVLVVMNDEIASARDVLKTDALRLHTFRSPNHGFLGVADPDAVEFYRDPVRPHTTASEFDVRDRESLPDVPIVADYTGSDGSMLREQAAKGAPGIVLIGFPTGLLSSGNTEAALEVASGGIPVVVTSRSPVGRVSDDYRIDDDGTRLIAGRDIPAHKARILLMLALTATDDPAKVQEIFDRY